MKKVSLKLSPREGILAGIVLWVILIIIGLFQWLLPEYSRWEVLQENLAVKTQDYARLMGNLTVRKSVDEQYEFIKVDEKDQESEHVILSQYLRGIEGLLADFRSLHMINAKPLNVKTLPSHQVYGVTLSLSGSLHELVQFVAALTNNKKAVMCVNEFSIRGVQGGNRVECSMTINMIRLKPAKKTKSKSVSIASQSDIKSQTGGVQ